jgi:hypothetical protein
MVTNRFVSMVATMAAGALVLGGAGAPSQAGPSSEASQAAVRTEPRLLTPHDPNWQQFFKLDWKGTVRHGHPVVEGHILNDGPYLATSIRLLVEALDEHDNVVAQRIEWLLPRELSVGTRGYFVIPAPQAAAGYRVSVFSFQSQPSPGM